MAKRKKKRLSAADQMQRRLTGCSMLQNGAPPTDVAKALSVSRSTVYAWKAVLDSGGDLTVLKALNRGGRPRKLSVVDVNWLKRVVMHETPEAHQIDPARWGLPAKAWTAALVCRLVKKQFGVEMSEVHMRRLVRPIKKLGVSGVTDADYSSPRN